MALKRQGAGRVEKLVGVNARTGTAGHKAVPDGADLNVQSASRPSGCGLRAHDRRAAVSLVYLAEEAA